MKNLVIRKTEYSLDCDKTLFEAISYNDGVPLYISSVLSGNVRTSEIKKMNKKLGGNVLKLLATPMFWETSCCSIDCFCERDEKPPWKVVRPPFEKNEKKKHKKEPVYLKTI